jgi:hypothetical protein
MTNTLPTAGASCFVKEHAANQAYTSPFSQPAQRPKTKLRSKEPKSPSKSTKMKSGKVQGKKKEPLIVERPDKQGKIVFCVQIRRQICGKTLSLSETSDLPPV